MQVGSYSVERTVERYGSVNVYVAWRADDTDIPVLLTVLNSTSREATERWAERYKAVTRLRHPNIVPFIDHGVTAEGQPFDATGLVSPVLGRDRILPVAAALEASRQICAALDYAHSQGIRHGMLRPAHIVKLGDDDYHEYALRGFELAFDTQPTTSADIAALGKFFHRALTGKTLEGMAVSPSLPRPLAEVIRKTLLGSKGFDSAGAFHAAFAQAAVALPAEEQEQPLVAAPASARKRRRLRPVLFVMPLIILFAMAGGSYVFINQQKTNALVLPTVGVLLFVSNTPIPAATQTPIPPSATPVPATSTPTEAPTEPGVVTATPMVVVTDTSSPTPSDTDVPPATVTDTATPIPPPPRPCVSMVGDSVTHGGITYEVPDSGYIVGLTHPLAEFVNQALQDQGVNNLIAYDRGASNTGINTVNHPSYFKSPAYTQLLGDHCKFTVIMPWFNDITPRGESQADAAPQHVRAIIGLIRILTERNPGGRILLMNYYQGSVAQFAADTWANGFTPENRDLYNHEIGASCQLGSISQIPQVTCFNTDDAFQGMGSSYVIGLIGREELNKNLVAPLSDIQQEWLDQYFATNPGGTLQGDGIHLSTAGKRALSAFLVKVVQSLPDLPMPDGSK